MPIKIDPDSFGFLMADISRMMRAEFDRRIAQTGLGLTAGEARALSHVARYGGVRQTVLAERMGIEPMTLSSVLDRLEARGLVSRQTDPCDRRAKLVDLTDAADAVLERIGEAIGAMRRESLRSLSESEWSELRGLMKRVRADLASLRAESPAPERVS